MTFHLDIKARITSILAPSGEDKEAEQLHQALVLLAKWRGVLIKNTVLAREGLRVQNGPFAGMEFLPESAEGCHVPKLLGCYEQPLHTLIEDVVLTNYSTILNIGCAEGYYAVGLARRMQNTRIIARDRAEHAQLSCRNLADKNGVSDQVVVGGAVSPEDLGGLSDGKTLLLCDIEGSEFELLDPVRAPCLLATDIIVEAHDCYRPGLSGELHRRFDATHDIRLIADNGCRTLAISPEWFGALSHLDQLLATWEWRIGATPWLFMRSKS